MGTTDQRAQVAPALIGLGVVALWALTLLAALHHAAPIDQAYSASQSMLDNPPILQDPPYEVARADFFVDAAAAASIAAAGIAVWLGLWTVRSTPLSRSARALGWTIAGIGLLGSPVALFYGLFGLLGCFVDGAVLLG